MSINSKKNKDIKYIENTNLDECDSKGVSQLYEYEIFGFQSIISVGKRNDEYIDKCIIYFPVYLIVDNKFKSKIGIIEINENCENNIYDEDGDIDIDSCSEPLFYNFVSYDYLNKMYHVEDKGYKGESMETNEYSDYDGDIWINTYLGSDDYDILDNDGDGDCLFIAIKDAYSGINIDISVLELRSILVDNVTETIYNCYKELYDSFKESILTNNDEMENIKIKNAELKKNLKTMNNRRDRAGILIDGESYIENFECLKNENILSNTLLGEYEFMSGVSTIEEFKDVLLKKEFWADAWTITILESVLNIKIIILSSENFETGDIDNILLCSQKAVNNKNPEYYIILDYNGNHYKLVTHTGVSIFNFEYLPKEIIELICNKCVENMGGSYNSIPDFMEINKDIKLRDDVGQMYNIEENTIFMIHPKSAGNHAPGKGSGENINTKTIIKYSELSCIKNWRRILSTHYESPFTLDDLKWNTIEHYLQGVKFKKTNPEYYKSFSLNSTSEYNKDPTLIKREMRANIKLCDEDYNYTVSMEKAYTQLFLEDTFFRKVLLLTKDAKIVYYVYRQPPNIMKELMNIRNNIQNIS